jgi:GMP synthase (glutamine-hydrolysing)
MDKTAIAIRHVAFEDLGSFAPVLADHGYRVAYREAGLDELLAPALEEADLLIVLGGPIGACDESLYPFLADELRLLDRRLTAGNPTLGICLGAQLMARSLGARVYAAPAKEIGWAPLQLTAAGSASCLRSLATEAVAVLHWHGDTFDVPAGATRLAATDVCPNQAFSLGPAVLALQFHAEVTAAALEQWFVGHAVEIAAAGVASVPELRADSARHAPSLQRHGPACLRAWLAQVAGQRGDGRPAAARGSAAKHP